MTTSLATSSSSNGFIGQMSMADVDGDGHLDVLTSDLDVPSSVTVIRGYGDGTFVSTVPPTTAVDTSLRTPHLADLNGDGVLDVAVASGTPQ